VMTSDGARTFANEWANHWNRRDVDAVLVHFAEAVVFSSPIAAKLTGRSTVTGTHALRAYWELALAGIQSLRFVVDRAIWDDATSELAIVYDREVNGGHDRAVEVLTFSADELVVRGEVFYGVTP
jgi:hypothetical protein